MHDPSITGLHFHNLPPKRPRKMEGIVYPHLEGQQFPDMYINRALVGTSIQEFRVVFVLLVCGREGRWILEREIHSSFHNQNWVPKLEASSESTRGMLQLSRWMNKYPSIYPSFHPPLILFYTQMQQVTILTQPCLTLKKCEKLIQAPSLMGHPPPPQESPVSTRNHLGRKQEQLLLPPL